MTKSFQINLFDYFIKNGIENYVGVPDSTLKHFISRALEKKKIMSNKIIPTLNELIEIIGKTEDLEEMRKDICQVDSFK